MENEEIKKAKKVLNEISQDDHERRMTELREKYIRDQYAIEERGYEKGLEAGVKQGVDQGIKQGVRQTKTEIVKKMKSKGFETDTICEITGLNEETINKILTEK